MESCMENNAIFIIVRSGKQIVINIRALISKIKDSPSFLLISEGHYSTDDKKLAYT